MSRVDTLEKAARFAKVTASDLAIYNTEKIERGLQQDRLFQEIADDLRDAEKNWRANVAPDLVENTGLLYRAIVDRVFAHDKTFRSPIF